MRSDDMHRNDAERLAFFSGESDRSGPAGARPRILVADDDADMRRHIAELLSSQFDVETVADGRAALAAMRRARPALLLADVMLPELDGLALLAEIRRDWALRDLPVVLLSAGAGEEARIEALRAGADEYVTKPFNARELIARVEGCLRLAALRREAADALREREERLRVALANSETGMFRWDPASGEYLDFDDNLKSLFGLETGKPVRVLDDLIDRIHPDDAPGLIAAIGRRRGGVEFEMEFRVILPDGSVRWLYDRAGLLPGFGGQPAQVVGTCTDITKRKLAELASARLAAIVEWSDDAIASKDLNGIITSWNRGAERIFGYTAEEAIGRPVTMLFPEGQIDEETRILDCIRRGEAIDHFETVRRRKDGRLIDVSLTVSPIFDGEGRVIGASKVARDVSEQVRIRERIAESERRLRTLADAVPNLVWSDTPDGQCDWLSSQWRAYTGIPEHELLGLRWLDRVIHPDDRAHTLACWQAACADQCSYDVEYRIRRHDGEYHWFKTRGVPIRDEQGQIIHWFGTCTDIEESKRHEAELRQADRRKDEFLATLAHELRNPLAPIRSSLDLLKLSGDAGPSAERIHAMMDRQLNHMVRLVDDLMDVSRITRGKIELRCEPVELASVVRGAVEASQPLIDAAGHSLALALPAEPVTLNADAVRVSQVLTNLLNNAAKYTPRGGQIWLTARTESGQVVIAVRDNGVGIPPAMLPRVFDMFAQVNRHLRRADGGLGIGLALARGLVEMHGGTLEVRSPGEGHGSEFLLRLPLASGQRAPLGAEGTEGHSQLVGRRLLVVDDNRDAADTVAMLLRALGAEARAVYGGHEALVSMRADRPDAVLLDLGMSGIDGYEVARRVRAEPELRDVLLIALTGWGQHDDRRRTQEAGFDAHLVKPVDHAALRKLLADLPRAARHASPTQSADSR